MAPGTAVPDVDAPEVLAAVPAVVLADVDPPLPAVDSYMYGLGVALVELVLPPPVVGIELPVGFVLLAIALLLLFSKLNIAGLRMVPIVSTSLPDK